MASQPISQPKATLGAPYCSDPNCPYCKELRAEQEAVMRHRRIPQKRANATPTHSRIMQLSSIAIFKEKSRRRAAAVTQPAKEHEAP
jgi:hypothetical protein